MTAPVTKPRTADVVVKAGGALLADPVASAALAADVVALHRRGLRPIVVHGGGLQITEVMQRLGVEAQFVHGQRVTSPDVLDVVRMVLTGRLQRELIGTLNRYGPYAVGLSGEDAHLMSARRRDAANLGQVGDVTGVDVSLLTTLLDDNRIPVISSLAVADDGAALNVNADAAAAAVAVAVGARSLVMLIAAPGFCVDWPEQSTPVPELTDRQLESMNDRFTGGMLPKAEACLSALRGGVTRVHITDGRRPQATLDAVTSRRPAGTTVVAAQLGDPPSAVTHTTRTG
ncbi:acetylglutamate kinase [Streptomyces sp. NPDC101166]|uniref:acetylglutamate kinase n=1 Tax=Streptomyces sp. NPDC101166 TaxID=3366120 RepID=UPI00381FB019